MTRQKRQPKVVQLLAEVLQTVKRNQVATAERKKARAQRYAEKGIPPSFAGPRRKIGPYPADQRNRAKNADEPGPPARVPRKPLTPPKEGPHVIGFSGAIANTREWRRGESREFAADVRRSRRETAREKKAAADKKRIERARKKRAKKLAKKEGIPSSEWDAGDAGREDYG